FSSRRRHTRWPRDWSSDVCSSDLALPLGAFRCDILLTSPDAKRPRIVAGYAFGKLGIPFWLDSGISAPSLVRVSGFAQGPGAACYGCELAEAVYACETSYPYQPQATPPPTNSPQHSS